MTLLPVVERELRASARHPFTFSLRMLGVVASLVALVLFTLRGNLSSGVGGELFARLHTTLFFAIWILVPLITADTISRERREGTLPLLFLTPLRALDIVYAKGLAHGLRAVSLWLAVVPVLTVCFVGGGVGWPEVVISVLINFSSLCLAMGAGLLASARSRVWTCALAVAMGLACLFLLSFILMLPRLVIPVNARMGRLWFPFSYLVMSSSGVALATDYDGLWQKWLTRLPPGRLLKGFATAALLAVGILFLLVRFVAWNVKRTWHEEPPSARVLWLRAKLFKPVLCQHLLRRWLNWELQHNPIGWLEQRSWSGRLVIWSWFAIVVCVYSSLFANLLLYQRAFHALQALLASLLAGSIALSAAGSFRRERETGVLELLLVAPLREWQIIAGRVRGLWTQFAPAIGLLCAVWLYCATFLVSTNELPSVLLYLVTFATVPFVGLYFSLASANFIVALLWTLALELVLPTAFGYLVELSWGPMTTGNNPDAPGMGALLAPACFQGLLAWFLAWRLHANLKCRKFAMAKGLTVF